MTEYVNYKTAPIGTVASDEITTLVKNDKGWYWLEDNLQEDGGHVVPREVVHEFQLGEVVTPETLGWLPPGSEITPERKDHALVRGTRGWVWADGLPGTTPGDLVARWVANTTYTLTKFTLTKFPGLDENPYIVAYTYNAERGTVYTTNPHHRDFGKGVELPNGRFLAVPNRAPREFETAQEAVEWLI